MRSHFLQGSSGTNESFAAFYEQHVAKVAGILSKIGVHDADIPDIAQQVFLKIHKTWEKPTTDGKDVSLETICRQQAAEHYRLYRHRFEQPEPDVGAELPAEVEDAHSQLERHEHDQIVRRVLEGMDPELRDVLVRHEFQNESLESIARAHSIARNTASTRLMDAKKIFRLRIERALRDQGSRMLVLSLATTNGGLPADFIEDIRTRVWRELSRELGLTNASEVSARDTVDKDPPSGSRRIVGIASPAAPRPFVRLIKNPIFSLSVGVLGGMVLGALLWFRDPMPIARHTPSILGGVVLLEREGARATTAAPSAAIGAVVAKPAQPISQINRELSTLERARTLVSDGQYAKAIDALKQHERDYPRSDLATARSRYRALAEEGLRENGTSAPASQ